MIFWDSLIHINNSMVLPELKWQLSVPPNPGFVFTLLHFISCLVSLTFKCGWKRGEGNFYLKHLLPFKTYPCYVKAPDVLGIRKTGPKENWS